MLMRLLAILSLVVVSMLSSRASVIVVAPTQTAPGSIQFTEDITFTITSSGFAETFVFDNWVTSDGSLTASQLTPDVFFSLNGGAPFQLATTLYDNLATNYGEMTPGDGYLFHTGIAVQPSDILAIKQGSYTLKEAGFNPEVTQTFTGNMFITNSAGEIISSQTVVPEPGTLALCSFGLTVMICSLQRRTHRAASPRS